MKNNNNNRRRNNNNNNNNNYFAKNIREKGPDFIHYKNARELTNDAPKIFREIARGQIDLMKYGEYFLDPQFLECCLQAAYNKYSFHSISQSGVDMLITANMNQGIMIDNTMVAVKESHKRTAEAYCIIWNTLNGLKLNQDLSNLFVLASQLQNYKYNI